MIPVADTRLFAVDDPRGAPALLFLGGGFGTVQNWSRVIRRVDVGQVIDATGIERPILVGWSHGATIAVRYAAEHPGRVGGPALIDGAYPIAMFDEAGQQKVRTQFRRLGWIMRILMDAVNGPLGPDFAAIEDVIHQPS